VSEPLQNRVTPFGEIVAVPARGTLMGNRGNLHDDHRHLDRTQSSRRDWVTCRLEFKNRRREVMSPGKYTELFFLDEVTALAAGHRPCGECRRDRFLQFRAAWAANVTGHPDARPLVTQIDPVLHADRLASRGVKRRFESRRQSLPDGVMVQLPGEQGIARLKWRGRLWQWSAAGYSDPASFDAVDTVLVLTPRCTVAVLAGGYVPEVHASAGPGFHSMKARVLPAKRMGGDPGP
jgi:hypothetical protein